VARRSNVQGVAKSISYSGLLFSEQRLKILTRNFIDYTYLAYLFTTA